MTKAGLATWLAPAGLLALALGVILYSQLDRLTDLRGPIDLLNVVVFISLGAQLLGGLAFLVGCALWAWKSPGGLVLAAAFAIGFLVLAAGLLDINTHGPLAGLMTAAVVGEITAPALLIVAVIRFARSRQQPSDEKNSSLEN